MKHKNKKLIFPPFTVLFFLLTAISAPRYEGLVTIFCACLHELGHYIAARLYSVTVERITVYPFGADMRLSAPLRSYKTDLVIALAGPSVNLLLCLAGYIFLPSPFFILCNLSLAIMNLLPVKGLDGGVIFSSVMLRFFSQPLTDTALNISSFLSLFIMWLISVYTLFIENGDPSLFVIVCTLFVSVFLKKRNENR